MGGVLVLPLWDQLPQRPHRRRDTPIVSAVVFKRRLLLDLRKLRCASNTTNTQVLMLLVFGYQFLSAFLVG